MVVEDHEALLELTKTILTRSGVFEIVGEAKNGADAIDVVAQKKPDLVLLDLKMPVKDGFQALPDLRRLSPESRVVAYSMLDREGSEARVLALGATLFIEKSVTSEELIARLLTLFGRDGSAPAGGKGGLGRGNAFQMLSWLRSLLPTRAPSITSPT